MTHVSPKKVDCSRPGLYWGRTNIYAFTEVGWERYVHNIKIDLIKHRQIIDDTAFLKRGLKGCCLFTIFFIYGLKDLLTVDVFSVYLLSRVDMVIRYIEVDFTFGLADYVRYIEELVITRFVISRFYSTHFTELWPGRRISFVKSRTSLNRGSLNRGPLYLDC